MASKAPPIPPQQRSAPDEKPRVQGQQLGRRAPSNLKEQGQAGNISQNTHNQGYQQDR